MPDMKKNENKKFGWFNQFKMTTGKTLLRALAGILCCFILSAVLPYSASAVEYIPLATIKRGLTYPTDVAVSGSGKIYVVDGLAKKVFTYNSGYILTGAITLLDNPTAVAVSGNTVFIADNTTKSVKRFTDAGVYAGDLKKNGRTALFNLPRNIAIDTAGNIYVVDAFADSIEVFNAAGSYVYTISGLDMPQDAVIIGDELFVIERPLVNTATETPQGAGAESELRVSRVRIYDLETRSFVDDAGRTFPSYGRDTTIGQYISLKGITADSLGYIYLNDSFLNVLYKFDLNGQFLGTLGEPVQAPLGAAVSADGRLLVASSYDGAVKVLGVDSAAGRLTWLQAPVADAGPDQAVKEGSTFILDGSGSIDKDGVVSYQWTQKSGPSVLPENPYVTDSAFLALTAPDVGPEGDDLLFELVVTDVYNLASEPATTTVTVNNAISGSVLINEGAHYTTDPLVSLSLNAPEAVEMRFANDDEPFTSTFYSYMSEVQWSLSEGDGVKYVNVEFRDAGGNTMVASNTIVLDTEKPAAPIIVDGGGIPGEFDWQPVDGAVSYTLQYAFNRDFTVGVVNLDGLDFNGATISLDGLAPGTWYWRVRAVDGAGNAGEWSEVNSFYVAPDCDASPETPLLSYPYDGAVDIARTAMLGTYDMIYHPDCGTHLRTEWQISRIDDFSNLVMDVGTTLDNLTDYRVPALVLDPATTYFWRVKQTASNGKYSGWSEAWQFTTEDLPDEQGIDGVLYVRPESAEDASDDEINIKETVGDADIKIKVVRVSSGVIAQTIKELDPETIPEDLVNKPDDFPLGLLSFKLTVEPGDWAQVEVTFSGSVPKDAEWYIYTADEGWHPYAGAIFSRNRRSVVLNFQDGGMGDTDEVANGVIVNP